MARKIQKTWKRYKDECIEPISEIEKGAKNSEFCFELKEQIIGLEHEQQELAAKTIQQYYRAKKEEKEA